jgi:very-short-patch-repair endonuclease
MKTRARISEVARSNAKQLRRQSTEAEKKLWIHLQNRQLGGFKFRRQHVIGSFIVDFYCHETRLAIELDGGGHNEDVQCRHDSSRTKVLEDLGIRVSRFWNHEVLQNIEAVVEEVNVMCSSRPPSPGGRWKINSFDVMNCFCRRREPISLENTNFERPSSLSLRVRE